MATRINVTVGSEGLLERNKAQTEANRQGKQITDGSTKAADEGVERRRAELRAAGLPPEEVERRLRSTPTSADTSPSTTGSPPRAERPLPPGYVAPRPNFEEPGAYRRGFFWLMSLSQSPTLIYNGPLAPAIGVVSGPGPSAFGTFTGEGNTWEYVFRGTGLNSLGGRNNLDYTQLDNLPILRAVYSGTTTVTQLNRLQVDLRRVKEHDKTDLFNGINPLLTEDSPGRTTNMRRVALNVWLGGLSAGGGEVAEGVRSTLFYEFSISLVSDAEPTPQVVFIRLATSFGAAPSTYNINVTGNPLITFAQNYALTDSLEMANLNLELSNSGKKISLFTRESRSSPFTLVGSQELSNPVDVTNKSIDRVNTRIESVFPVGQNLIPPPVAIGPILAKIT